MTKVNQVDSLTTELRDIKRRLHALETALGSVLSRAVASSAARAAGREQQAAPPDSTDT